MKKSRIASRPSIPKVADEWVAAGGLDPDAELSAGGKKSTWVLDQIQNRAEDTRPLKQEHVQALVESISVLGLIEPLVIDQDGKLLAGGHRKAAISLLRETQPDQYHQHFPENLVPVRIMDFSSEIEPDRAIEIEISENELRRDYSKAEVLAIASRLRNAGYKDTPGRPKKGEKRLKPALSTIFGKSIRTVERYLSEETPTNGGVFPGIHLSRALPHLKKWQKERGETQEEQDLAQKLPELIELMKAVLEGNGKSDG